MVSLIVTLALSFLATVLPDSVNYPQSAEPTEQVEQAQEPVQEEAPQSK